jgi:hypothetical protein
VTTAQLRRRASTGLNWLFRNRRTGRITVAQFPNVSLTIFFICQAALWLWNPAGTVEGIIDWTGRAELAWWSVDEIARGVNPFRRLLGLVILVRVVLGVVAPRYVIG